MMRLHSASGSVQVIFPLTCSQRNAYFQTGIVLPARHQVCGDRPLALTHKGQQDPDAGKRFPMIGYYMFEIPRRAEAVAAAAQEADGKRGVHGHTG